MKAAIKYQPRTTYAQRTGQNSLSGKILASAFTAAPEYRIDSKGRKVRVFTSVAPCSEQDVFNTLQWNRVVTEDECLEGVGQSVFQYMIKVGYLRKDTRADYYWVTKACAEKYNLSNKLNMEYPA